MARIPRTFLTAACAGGLLAAAAGAGAQTPGGGPARPDPLDPNAPVPAYTFTSSLGSYRGWDDSPPLSWRQANDDVARIGGWRTYLRQAQAPDAEPGAADKAPAGAPAAASPAANTPSAPTSPDAAQPPKAGHGGHRH